MSQIEGNFEKGVADGAEETLKLIALAAANWRGTTVNLCERWILPPILDLIMRR
jgi:hypothetical protein